MVVSSASSAGIDPARAMELLNMRSSSEGRVGPGLRSCPCHTGGDGEVCMPIADGSDGEVRPTAVSTHDMRGMGVPELVRLLHAMQSERVESYSMFEHSFRTFLDELSAPRFEHVCASVTAEFGHISGAINAIGSALVELSADGLAKHVRGLQELEKRKLSVTIEHQLVRRELRVAELRSTVDADVASAIGEKRAQDAVLRAGLAELVGEINDVMDEIQCALTDLEAEPEN